jgi:hypothetical protein
MVGLLYALPNTQLTRRLQREGRYIQTVNIKGDQCTGSLNFVTLRPRRDVLADYRSVLQSIYSPAAYFGRVRAVGRALSIPDHAARTPFKDLRRLIRGTVVIAWRMTVRHPELRSHFLKTWIACARSKMRNLDAVMSLMAFYLHVGYFAQFLIGELDREIALLDEAGANASRIPAAAVARPTVLTANAAH